MSGYEREAVEAYIEAALWSSSDQSDDQGGVPLDDQRYGREKLAPGVSAAMGGEMREFLRANVELLDGLDPGQIGHDFWLTRNGHGAGFWDRGLGRCGEELTEITKAYGSSDLYVGDDGLIYVTP